ncbi:hypothetical protein HZC00_05505 [Candidatus Kaiserbacteria bacterium]|nr:hypothetical protein [Candidatus Kaiserbacteria bacterium]
MEFMIPVPEHVRDKDWLSAIKKGFPEVVWSDDHHGIAEINVGIGSIELAVEVKGFAAHVTGADNPFVSSIKKVCETRVNMAFTALGMAG